MIFIQVQTTDGLCHNRALTVGGLSPPKLKTQREITGIRETTRRTSRRVTITPSQKKLIEIVTVIVMTTQREGRNTMKNMKKNMTMIMSILANLCSIGSVNQKLKIFEKSKFDCDF